MNDDKVLGEEERPDEERPDEEPRDAVPALPLTAGTGLALLGSGLAALSTGFAWVASLVPASFGPQTGYLASDIPLPAMLNQTSTGTTPTVGLVALVLAVLTAALVLLSSAGRWSDIVRRLLGVVIVGLVGLVAWRYHAPALESEVGFLSSFRAGAYLAVLGGVLIAVFGPPIVRSEPGRLDVLPEDLA